MILKMDGFDDCIIGVCCRYGQEDIIAYDLSKVMQKLLDSGMEPEEAMEHFPYNILGSWVGEYTPCFIVTKSLEEIEEEYSE